MGDTVPKPTWDQATAIVRRSGFTRTGANLTWEAGNLLMLACATRDESLLEQATEAITGEVRITTEEGIQPDFSFHQHGPQLYMSNYGEVFSTDNSRYAQLLAGTEYAFTEDQIHALSGLIREGQQWFIWGRQFDYHALGRQLDRSSAAYRGRSFEGISRRMAVADPDHADEYADFAARVTGAPDPRRQRPARQPPLLALGRDGAPSGHVLRLGPYALQPHRPHRGAHEPREPQGLSPLRRRLLS